MRASGLVAAVAVALLLAPGVLSQPTGSTLDLSGRIPAGEFRAWRVRLLEPGTIVLGATYDNPGVGTEHPVIPLLTVLQGPAGADVRLYQLTDDTMFRQPAGYQVVVRTPLTVQGFGAPKVNYMVGGGEVAYGLPAAEYVLLVASANGTDYANLRVTVAGAAEVLAAQAGRSFYERGLDHSAAAFDAALQGAAGAVRARAWGYSGADLGVPVGGRLYGVVDDHQGAAYLEAPDGTRSATVLGGPAGTWTAAFPPAAYLGPACVAAVCPPLLEAREDPPFVLAADLTV